MDFKSLTIMDIAEELEKLSALADVIDEKLTRIPVNSSQKGEYEKAQRLLSILIDELGALHMMAEEISQVTA